MRFTWGVLLAGLCLTYGGYANSGGATDNVRTAKRVFLEAMAQGRFEKLEEIYTPDFVAHAAGFSYNLAQDSEATRSWRTAMPDLKVTVDRTVAEHDLVALHWHVVGTNTVAAGGMPGDGSRLGVEGMTIFRFASGRIAEAWTVVDIATLRKELGEVSKDLVH